jgi:hypothetical protein
VGIFRGAHEFYEAASRKNYDAIINVGVSDGYYLVGLGRRYPLAHLIGF